jgi:Fic family protein
MATAGCPRSLQTLMIAREGVLAPEFSSIEAWLGLSLKTWDYYQELASRGPTCQPDQDLSSWVRFNLTAYHQQAQTVQKRLDRSSEEWRILAGFAERNALDERVVSALHDVAVAGRVRRSRYEQGEGLSLRQAQRDLRDLVTARILRPVGRPRARYYLAGDRFPEQATEIATTPMTLAEPYRG